MASDGLTQAQLDELRAELDRELARLTKAMKGTKDASQPVTLDQGAVGRVSRIDAIQNQLMSASAYGRDQVRYAALIHAIERMEHGTYGRCARCGNTIPYGRLLVLPESANCAGCGGG
ncbi:MAG: TraR/DksA C4-type zinc finger protein [Gemmatimonadaceae bacterium]